MFPGTSERVSAHTAPPVNERMRREMLDSLGYFAAHPHEIDARLAELGREWDVERVLEANASALAFVGVALGVFVHASFLLLPALVAAFLFQHALQGWCPPIPIIRRLGVRTLKEIDDERHALKLLRGDYRGAGETGSAATRGRAALAAARR